MSKIKILGHTWEVKKAKIPEDNGYIVYGRTYFRDHKIVLDRRNCPGQNTETLLHEIFHVISCYTGSNLTEKQVTSLSNAMYAVIKDNKKIIGT